MTEVLVPLSDGDLFCRVIGHGPPVVLLHGYSQDQRVFAGWEDGLTRHRTVILVDSRNHGRSWKTRQVSIPLMAGDVAGVLAWLGYDRAAVVGYSDGGNVALQLAADHGEMVEKLVVISGNATPGGLRAGPRFVYNAGYWLTRLVSGTPGMLRLITREPQLSSDDLRRITVPALLV
ncbi:MAG: alpha/beta hydrolase, partial [Propionibacteriaceae bacterium]|nr:alpha/beta hydrolase [Propionibacteriaceae bacterium]